MNDSGIALSKIGTHSFRKGAATYVSGLTDGPDTDSINLQMEHKIGGSNDLYIKPQLMKDKYVARSSAGLDDNSIAFSVLSPHFEEPVKITFEDLIPMSTLKKIYLSLLDSYSFVSLGLA